MLRKEKSMVSVLNKFTVQSGRQKHVTPTEVSMEYRKFFQKSRGYKMRKRTKEDARTMGY